MSESMPESQKKKEALLEVSNLEKHFDQSSGFLDQIIGSPPPVRAVDGVDLTVYEGETLAVVGESGCGKSTLGQTILKLHEPTGGKIVYNGNDITDLSTKQMKEYRKEMQIIFQDPLASLNPRKTIRKILTTPMKIHNIRDSKADRVERAKELLERVGLKEAHINRYPHQFSGGQQQRIAIARVLSVEPDFIIADEPVSALDVSVQAQILNLLDELIEDLGLSLFFIAHDLSVVRHIADRVAVMYLGEKIEVGQTEDVFWNPQHPYTKSLLSAVPRVDPEDREERVILEGTVPSPLDPPSGCRFHTRCPAVIPPDDWTATQETFVSVYSFRNRVESEEVNVEAIRTRLDSRGEDTTAESIAEHIIERYLKDPNGIPEKYLEPIRAATAALVDGNDDKAKVILSEAFPSPCDQESPRPVSLKRGHSAKCHRIDEEMPGTSLL